MGRIIDFDLYDLLIDGSRTEDLIVEAGDTVLVKLQIVSLKFQSEVNRPGKYEYLEGESLEDIFNFSLGLSGIANTSIK